MLSAGAILCVTDFGGASDNGVESSVAAKVNSPEPGDEPNQVDLPRSPSPLVILDSKDHASDLESGWSTS